MVDPVILASSSVGGVAAAAAAVKLWRTARTQRNQNLKHFAFSFFLLALFWVLFLGHSLVTGMLSGVFAVTGIAALLFSFAFFSRIPVDIHFPMYEAWIFWIGFVAAALGSGIITLHMSESVALPLISDAWGTTWITLLGLSLGAIFAFALLGAITFYRQATRTGNTGLHYRSLLLATGYILAPIATLFTVMAGNRLLSLVFLTALSLATALLSGGVFIRHWISEED